jgi:chromate transport protein ChrA
MSRVSQRIAVTVILDTLPVKRYTQQACVRPAQQTSERIPIRDLVPYYLRLGVLGFGGPVALVGQMERELVGEKKWLTKEEMREGIAVCQSLPGPLAIQVGIWISYIRGGFWGAWAAFFLKAGSLTFGSGLVIVPFLEKGLVQQTGWLNEREFLVAVAMGMISPGPLVITATFVGYLVAARLGGSLLDGFWGSLVSTISIFLPSFLLILVVARILLRYRQNSNVQGFIRGAYAAAIGTILGACVLLGKIAIGDWLTALVAFASLIVLFRWKVSNPVLVAATAIIGLIAFPLLKPDWVFVK